MPSLKRLSSIWLISAILFFCLHSASAQPQSNDPKPKATGSISGHVTIGDKPAPGILITASTLNGQAGAAQATSDTEGNYRINGLASGQISINPFAPVYVFPASSMYGQGKVINLAAGESVDGIDFKLTRGGVITGRVTDADGRALIEERVNLLQVDENGAPARTTNSRPSNFQMYQTDDRGIYRVYGLAPGRYKVSAGDEVGMIGGLRLSGYYQKTFYPDATDPAKASIIDLNEGTEAKDVDIHLGRRAATYTVSGRIVDADTGQPLPGIPFGFGVVQKNQNQSYLSSTSPSGAPTNSRGEFRVEGVEPGHYGVFAGSDRYDFYSNAGPSVYSDPILFDVVEGDVTNLEVKARRGLSLSGIVIADEIVDKKVLARLSSLRIGASVNPATSGIRVMPQSRAAALAADGSFQIEGLSPGTASLYLTSSIGTEATAGFSISRIEKEGVLQNRGIEIQPGQGVSGIRIHLAYGTGVVRGQVKVEGGALSTDLMFFVALITEGRPTRYNGQVDSRGRFIIQHVAAGTYEVMMQIVSLGPSTPLPRGFPRTQRQTVTVTDDAESEVLFTLDLSRKEGP